MQIRNADIPGVPTDDENPLNMTSLNICIIQSDLLGHPYSY